jgi:Na+/proline symporter
MANNLPYIILGVIAMYFVLLTGISYWTTKKTADNDTFFLANRKAPWYLVTIGLIGASISGVTFVSIPGKVGAAMGSPNMAFSYLQLVFGYVLGYAVIALVLMPVYYRMNLVSIYTYLEERFGWRSYKTGAAFFLISRTLGSSLRMFLMVLILQQFALDPLGVPIQVTAFVCIFLVWLYTYKGGTQTILYTDVVLTFCFLLALVLTIISICSAMDKNIGEMSVLLWRSDYSKIFFFQNAWSDPNNFFKQFISGALITITMTGMDQDLMQKNLACKNIGEAQKNMFTFSGILLLVNILFLMLGGFLYIYASTYGIELPAKTDLTYPTIALKHLSSFSAIIFIVGIVGSTFSSSDSALTALTTSVCVDFFDFNKKVDSINHAQYDYNEQKIAEAEKRVNTGLQKQRLKIHTVVAAVFYLFILLFAALNDSAIIDSLFKTAGYTYGPLLGLFSFGLMTDRKVMDKYVPLIAIAAPLLTFALLTLAEYMGVKIGFLNLLLNGLLMFAGVWAISKPAEPEPLKSIIQI